MIRRSKLILIFPCCTSFSFLSTDAVGVPLYLFVELYKHREHFYVKKDGTYSDKHDWAYARLGGMFTQYEPQFWFWEIGNLIFKLCITGVLCIVAQGSAFQVILALVFCMINANLLLRFAPYDSETSDTLSIICAVCLTMTVLGGFVLMANETMKTVNPVYMDYGLIALNVVPLVLFVVHVVRLIKTHGRKKRKNSSGVAVVPIDNKREGSDLNALAPRSMSARAEDAWKN